MRIFVDADACPVKAEALKVAERYSIPVFIVSNGGMRPSRDPLVTNITVASTPDAADDWIAENVESGDIVITADIPLAARSLDASATALGPSGKEFTAETVGMALAVRGLNQHLRESTQQQTYNRPFNARDRSAFLQSLDRLIVRGRTTK